MSTDSFSRTAWDRNAPIYDVIRRMPFNAELAAGSLSEARFKHYITQDAHYCSGQAVPVAEWDKNAALR